MRTRINWLRYMLDVLNTIGRGVESNTFLGIYIFGNHSTCLKNGMQTFLKR